MITDPWFYVAAIVGTFLIGLSKSGFLPGIGSLGVPLMALTMPPVEAAAIQLPLLVATDALGIWSFRRDYDRTNLRILLPSAFIGVFAGWATAHWVSESMLRIVVGVIGVVFVVNYWWRKWRSGVSELPPRKPDWVRGTGWGSLAAYTSFFAHAGLPAYAVYILPQRLPNAVYAGTMLVFFAIVNVLKLPAYFALGQLTPRVLLAAALMFPVAWVSTMLGIKLVRSVPAEPFYKLLYGCQLAVSAKLVWDGVAMLVRA